MNFSERLRKLRASQNVSQAKLASILGMSERVIRYYEAATKEPTLSVLVALADYFQVSIDYLVGRSDDPSPR